MCIQSTVGKGNICVLRFLMSKTARLIFFLMKPLLFLFSFPSCYLHFYLYSLSVEVERKGSSVFFLITTPETYGKWGEPFISLD